MIATGSHISEAGICLPGLPTSSSSPNNIENPDEAGICLPVLSSLPSSSDDIEHYSDEAEICLRVPSSLPSSSDNIEHHSDEAEICLPMSSSLPSSSDDIENHSDEAETCLPMSSSLPSSSDDIEHHSDEAEICLPVLSSSLQEIEKTEAETCLQRSSSPSQKIEDNKAETCLSFSSVSSAGFEDRLIGLSPALTEPLQKSIQRENRRVLNTVRPKKSSFPPLSTYISWPTPNAGALSWVEDGVPSPTDFKNLILPLPRDTLVYQDSLMSEHDRLGTWRWRTPRGSLTMDTMLRRLKRALRKSPDAARKLAKSTLRAAGQRSATTPTAPSLRKQKLAKFLAGFQVPERRDAEEGADSQRLCSAWALLSGDEQRRVVQREWVHRHMVQPPAKGKSWETVGLARLHAKEKSMRRAFYMWKLVRTRRSQEPSSTPTTLTQRIRIMAARAAGGLNAVMSTVMTRAVSWAITGHPLSVSSSSEEVTPICIESVPTDIPTPGTCNALNTTGAPELVLQPAVEGCRTDATPDLISDDESTTTDGEVHGPDGEGLFGKCDHVLLDGNVQWRASKGTRSYGTLAAATDGEGPLLLVFYAYLRGHRVKVLVDSGASDNFVSKECVKRCNLTVRTGSQMRVTLADGSVQTSGDVAYTKFTVHGADYSENRMALRVLPLGVRVDMILGGRWLRSLSPITLDYAGNGSVSFLNKAKGGGGQRTVIIGCNPGMPNGRAQGAGLVDEVFLSTAQLKKHIVHAETRRLRGDEEYMPAWLMMAARREDGEGAFAATAADLPMDGSKVETQDTRDAKVTPTWKKRFDAFFDEYAEELRASLPEKSKLRHVDEDEATINLKHDKEGGPPCRRPYKMSMEELRQLRERIETLMEKGYIRPSSSPYAAPCLMVPKPGDPKVLRLVVDYRQLNQQTVRDRYPLPDIQLMFDEMQGAKFFSSFDAVDGFWQVPMATRDVEKTAFTTQMGAYEWLVMPQGLQNSPSQYQRRMQRALGHLPFVRIFIDDCVVFSKTVAEHYANVKAFLDACREKGVYLKASKAQIGPKESLRFLGHTLSGDGCQPQHDKIASVKNWPALESVTHVRQFLGLAGYYRRFVHCFSEIAQPLTNLTKADTPWQWGEQQQWAFEEIKAALSSSPVLALPDIKKAADGTAPFLVQTDASGMALGGVLMQDTGDGLKPIAYESRQFSAAEQNYGTGERELCALHHCCTVTWRHYLIFSEFNLQGDHRPLEWLMSPGRELSRRQARWYLDLVEVGVPRMEYIKGALLLVPDALSRRPDYSTTSPRDGLVEAGAVDKITDLPTNSLNSLRVENDYIGDLPPASVSKWLGCLESWMDGVVTLQTAERALEGVLNLKEVDNMLDGHASPTDPGKVIPRRSVRLMKEDASTTIPPEKKAETSLHTGKSSSDHNDFRVKGVSNGKVATRIDTSTSSPQPQSASYQACRVSRNVFDRLQARYGEFDVDACCDEDGSNRQVDCYWSDCLKRQWRGKHVWCSPPHDSKTLSIESILRKYVDEWRHDQANTSAVFMLPDIQNRMPRWRTFFRMAGMRVEEVIPTHDAQGEPTQLFEDSEGLPLDLPWPVLVVYAPPTKELPVRVRYPRVVPPVIQEGMAAKTRDSASPTDDRNFISALRDEYVRPGPLQTLRAEVMAAPHRTTRDFRIVGEVLWRVSAGRYQLVLGEDSPLREVIFKEAHDSVAAGHTGREKTLERVLRRFWWKNATDDVAAWVASCTTCQMVRPRTSFPDGLLNPHPIPERNWQVVGVDFVTGLPLTRQGHDAFATFTCKLSKMVHVVPMNFGDSSAQSVARIYFDTVWRQHGAPMKIICDRDPRFQDAFWKELMRLMGVKVASTTPYNPRSDGQAEHTNRVVEDMLRSFVGANPEDWDLFATNVEFAINDSRSDVTGFTPFELCYGVSPMSQLDMFVEAAQYQPAGSGRRKGGVGTAHEMATRFSSQLRDARSRLELAQQRQRAQFDQRHGHREYAVGDMVLIEARHLTEKLMDRKLCRKLAKRWHGPVPVVERFYSDIQAALPEADRGAPVAYRLMLPKHWRVHDVFAQHRLKPFVAGSGEFAARKHIPIPEKVIVDGQAEAYVDKILAYRVRPVKGKQIEEWKVSWTGYSSAHDQWRTREKMDAGGDNEQLRDFEAARLRMQAENRDAAAQRRIHRQPEPSVAYVGVTLSQLLQHPCDEPEVKVPEATRLPWERLEILEDGSCAYITELEPDTSPRPVRILVMFSGTGSVERGFTQCFPSATVVTLDSDAKWCPTHITEVESWDPRQYSPGFFDVIWASPPCTQYSQARTTGGPPDLELADACVQHTLDVIEYLKPRHWFIENPTGRYPNALRLQPVMQKLPVPLFCTYCKYGMRYCKPTCIWTSSPPGTPLLECTSRTPCMCKWATGGHPETAQLGPHPTQTGAGKSHAVYPIPGPLLIHLFHHLKFNSETEHVGEP
jgi:hypothetical protein